MEQMAVSSIAVEPDGFEEWLHLASIEYSRADDGFSATYKKDEDHTYELDNGTVCVKYELYAPWHKERLEKIEAKQAVSVIYTSADQMHDTVNILPGIWEAPIGMQAQVQPLTYRDLQQIEGLNLQGTRRAIWLFGDIEGIVRFTQQGGDLITFPGKVAGFRPGTVWLTALAAETWGPGWCHVIATLQNGG
jgi:hypothetical protein